MKIVIAPDSFKESLSSSEVASELEAGLRRVWPNAEYVKVPMADGGEGTVQALVDATGGEFVRREVTGPLGAPVVASYGLLGGGQTAVIEMAEASGLPLVPRGERDPLRASTYGTGELVLDAIGRGVKEIIVGLGGSATNDGGAGFAQALGVRFLGADGVPILEPLGGGRLAEIVSIDASGINAGLSGIKISVASDVTNPLTGPSGASAVYGPQKGATPEMVQSLDSNLGHLALLVKRDLGRDVSEMPGAGAGGGLGWALLAFTNATVKRGIEIVVEATGLDRHMKGADLAVTGEGRVDFQTAFGKTPSGVAASARRAGVPVVAIGGGLSEDAKGVFQHGIDGLEACTANPMSLEKALSNARQYLQDAAERVARLIVVGQRMAAANAEAEAFERGMPLYINKPVRHPVRVKHVRGLTREAVRLMRRRQMRAGE
ncbi:MAG: glycerate kinase [Hyphomicrobium sp.]|jgi:glycerate kinase